MKKLFVLFALVVLGCSENPTSTKNEPITKTVKLPSLYELSGKWKNDSVVFTIEGLSCDTVMYLTDLQFLLGKGNREQVFLGKKTDSNFIGHSWVVTGKRNIDSIQLSMLNDTTLKMKLYFYDIKKRFEYNLHR